MPDPLRLIGLIVLWVATVIVVVWYMQDSEPTDTIKMPLVQRPMQPDDLSEASTPGMIKKYQAPDSQDTRTDCITLPSWISPLTTERHDSLSVAGTTRSTTPSTEWDQRTTSRLRWDGLNYVITPMTDGRPRLSVGSEQVVFPGVDPRTGAGRKYTYRVPTPDWLVTARATATAGRKAATATSSLLVEHRGDWGTLGIGPAVQGVVTQDGYEAGGAITISYSKTLRSR